MATEPAEAFQEIGRLLGQNRLADAERLCRAELTRRPASARLHYALGFTQWRLGRLAEAEAALRRAVEIDPGQAETQHALGILLRQRGNLAAALPHLASAAGGPGATAEMLFNLGALHWERGEARAAIDAFRRTVARDDRLAAGWHALGLAYASLNENDDALAALRRAVACAPHDAAMHVALGQALLDLGRKEAAEPFARAAELDPRSARIADGHAQALVLAGRIDEALGEHARACALADNAAPYRLSHAGTLAAIGREKEADGILWAILHDGASRVDDRVAAHLQFASRALHHGKVVEGRAALDAAIALSPENIAPRLRRAMLLLSLGEFDEGWRNFEARFSANRRSGGILGQPFPQPRWDGSDLAGKTILAWSEQGIGDDILLSSMIPDLARRAGQVLLHIDRRLVPVCERSFPGNVKVYPRVLPVQLELESSGIDWQTPLGSLGRFLRPDWASFGRPAAYLRADADKIARFRQRYAALPGLKVGIAWRSQNLMNGRVKSSDLVQWEPLLRQPGVSFVNLQYGNCGAELARVRDSFGVEIFHDPDVDQLVDMDMFMAQVASLDLVIAVSNAIAHTAGALGVATFVLLATDPLWVWFRGRDDSPWYPNVRLFRQRAPGDWSGPIGDAAASLAQHSSRMASS